MKVDLDIQRDGFVEASYLETVLNQCFDLLYRGEIEPLEKENDKLSSRIKALEEDLAAERRLRLGMGRRQWT